MVNLRPWIDLTPERPGAATASQLTQADRPVTGTVSEILDDGTVAVSIDGSTEPDVVVPSASGITAVGASVRVSRDSSGRAVEASIPESIPPGASTAPVGVTGDWLMGLDALTATLDSAQGELSDAQAALKAHLAELGINTDSVTVTDELWARLAVFAQVTTDMLIAGNATITNELLVNTLVGKVLQGGLLLAGGGGLPQVLVGPLSGTPGTGDAYGVYLTTPNSNANGSASLEVTPTGPVFSMLDGSGNAILSMDKANGLKIVNATDGGLINLSDFVTKRWQWDSSQQGNVQVAFNSTSGWSPWAFFEAANNNVKIPSIATVTSPTGRFRIDCGWELPGGSAYDNTLMQLQFGFYTKNPNSFNRTDITNSLLGQLGRANAAGPGIVGVHSGQGSEVFTGAANTTYWVRPFYRQRVMGSSVTAIFNRMWASITPA